MINILEASHLVFISLLMPILTSAGLFLWGRRVPRQGDWLMALAFALSFVGLSIAGIQLARLAFKPDVWERGWIWSRSELGSITIGIFADPTGLAIALMMILAALVLLSQRAYLNKEPRVERIYAALGFCFPGVALAWFSLTPWLAIIGLLFTVFGGFLALGARWDSLSDANTATRFAWERMSGILLCIFGACGLAANRISFGWMEPVEALSTVQRSTAHDFMGASLLILGLYLQSQPFPLLGWLSSASQGLISIRVIFAQASTAVAAFGVLYRLEPQLRRIGLFPHFGWISLVSAFLALAMGLGQTSLQASLGAWLSAGMSLCVAALAFSGQASGLSLLFGVFLGVVAIASCFGVMDTSSSVTESALRRGRWIKVIGFLGMCSATGMIGFFSASGIIHWITLSWKTPLQASVVLLVLFLFALLGWKLMWTQIRANRPVELSWFSIFCSFSFIGSSIALFWTGRITGGVFPSAYDQVFPSLLEYFFTNDDFAFPDRGLTGLIAPGFLVIFLTALVSAFWVVRKDASKDESQNPSGLRKKIVNGYGVDEFAKFLMDLFKRIGLGIESLVDQKIWSEWIPGAMSYSIRRISKISSDLDTEIYRRFFSVLKNGVEAPAKAMQFLQNGDVQWYLLLAVGSGIAMLIHFMKF